MQNQTKTDATPLSDLARALFMLDLANSRLMDAERELAKERRAFQEKLQALGTTWAAAQLAAEKLEVPLPDAYREGGLLIRMNWEDGKVSAERLPDAANSFELFDLAEKAGERVPE